MPDEVHIPGRLRASAIEWRARQIDDPLQRLRYLRRTAGRPSPYGRLASSWKHWTWRTIPIAGLAAILMLPSDTASKARPVRTAAVNAASGAPTAPPDIWPVEQSPRFDLFSNGLRIENEFAIANEPRRRFPIYRHQAATSDDPTEWRSEPVGVVFHSTESHQVPFAPTEVRSLKRIGRNLLEYVRSQRSYHFVVDRFGRVYRIVHETDRANHAGKSIWSDKNGAYVNLNSSFLSVAFESQTEAVNPLNPAQLHAARILTEMLRSRFKLDAANFVTHAQVSVNPANMRIGYHTDWATGFPFRELGLPDNYAQDVPSVALFGFEYDDTFLNALGGLPWAGLAGADLAIGRAAEAARLSPTQYRKALQQRYRRIINAQSRMNEESQDES
jgi:hypothetical protein